MVIDDTGSVEDIHAFIYCTKWRSGQVSPMPHSQMKDRATQLLIKYKSGALVTQFQCHTITGFDTCCTYVALLLTLFLTVFDE